MGVQFVVDMNAQGILDKEDRFDVTPSPAMMAESAKVAGITEPYVQQVRADEFIQDLRYDNYGSPQERLDLLRQAVPNFRVSSQLQDSARAAMQNFLLRNSSH